MDKNSTIGMVVIAAILLSWSYFFPSDIPETVLPAESTATISYEAPPVNWERPEITDSAMAWQEEFITIENELVKITLSTKGGRIYAAELKNTNKWNGEPVQLLNGKENRFGFILPLTARNVTTNDELFQVIGKSFSVSGNDSSSVTMRLPLGSNAYVDYVYTLKGNSYLVDYKVNFVGVNQIINPNTQALNIEWRTNLIRQEEDRQNEQSYTTIYYDTVTDDVNYLSETTDESEEISDALKWVSFKQRFFSSALIADKNFASKSILKTVTDAPKDTLNLKTLSAGLSVDYHTNAAQSYGFKFLFAPNLYPTLKAIGYDLQHQVNLGWGPLGWINRWAVIPVFNFLGDFGWNYGIIILALTIILKLVLLPLTYSSYLSQAKMKVLKPEMDEIKARVGENDQTRLQQEYMKLYQEAGVNPLAGCVPLLLQMPILLAFFRFFPVAYELRQQSFLWVPDLSTYDSLISWNFEIPFIGSHLSLMCLLMTLSTLMYTWMNNRISGVTGQMKYIGYIMPVVFLGALNSFPAGLNFYYLCANLITFAQQFVIRKLVNDDAIHAKIQENKKRPKAKEKSKWQVRLEEMAKQQQERNKQNNK